MLPMESSQRPNVPRRRRPPPVFSQRETLQLVAMSIALLTVFACILRLRQPGSMNWFFAGEKETLVAASTEAANAPIVNPPERPIDVVHADRGDAKPMPSPLDDVNDRTEREAADRPAIVHLLAKAKRADPAELARASRKDILFANLLDAPQRHRGELVRMQGLLRRAVRWPLEAGNNEAGIAHYFECWIFTEDQRVNPSLLLCTELPPGLSPSATLSERVEVDAYFLKLFVYRADDGNRRVAPLLVGHRLRRSAMPTLADASIPWQAWAVVCMMALAAALLWRMTRSRAAIHARLRRPFDDPSGDQNPFG